MDIDEALKELRDLIAALDKPTRNDAIDALNQISWLTQSMAEFLDKGGYMPRDWV